MLARSLAALVVIVLAGCTGDAPLAPPGAITLEDLPTAEVDDLREAEQAELARIEARRDASAGSLDSLAAAWKAERKSWDRKGALLLCAPRSYDGAAAIIGPEGGVLTAGVATLHVPPGALDRPTVITMEAPVSFAVTAEFRPHGLQFRARPVLSLNYKHCLRPKSRIERVAYVDADDSVLEWTPSVDRLEDFTVDAHLEHFSRYAVAF
jgi:hypothetical protein